MKLIFLVKLFLQCKMLFLDIRIYLFLLSYLSSCDPELKLQTALILTIFVNVNNL